MTEPSQQTGKALQLFFLAQSIAHETPAFYDAKGAGSGDLANHAFMKRLRHDAKLAFGTNYSEKRACKATAYSFDFYFPEEKTAVEIALSLHNPISEYERDIFKCLLAQDDGLALDALLFIARPGAFYRQGAPGPRRIADFVLYKFNLRVSLLELIPNVSAEDILKIMKSNDGRTPMDSLQK